MWLKYAESLVNDETLAVCGDRGGIVGRHVEDMTSYSLGHVLRRCSGGGGRRQAGRQKGLVANESFSNDLALT